MAPLTSPRLAGQAIHHQDVEPLTTGERLLLFWDSGCTSWPEPIDSGAQSHGAAASRDYASVKLSARPRVRRRRPGTLCCGRANAFSTFASAGYVLAALSCAALLSWANATHPFWHAHWDSWHRALAAQAFGSSLCLSAVIAGSERPIPAALWIIACLVLGAPACCLWVGSRLCRFGHVP